MDNSPEVILASTSVYRAALLKRLHLEFTQIAPMVDESRLANESPMAVASRLATEKAEHVFKKFPRSIVIGSDQVCAVNQEVLGKPHDFQTATLQLQKLSGKKIFFYTALSVFDPNTEKEFSYLDKTEVVFRDLSHNEIINYLNIDKPFDCAGSFKVESLGSTLFKSINNSDPSALMGLPLIKVCEFLRLCGKDVLHLN